MTEALTETPAAALGTPRAAALRVRAGNLSETYRVGRGASLLRVAAENDTSLTFVCCRGVCGACLVRVAANEQNLSPKTPAEHKLLAALGAPDDTRLACQCSVLGDVEIELVPESEPT